MSPKNGKSNRPVWLAIPLLLAFGITIGGILWNRRPPVVSEGQLRYIQLLRTAVSSQNEEHVAGVERVLKKRLEGGDLTPKEWRHFQGIIHTARRREWDSAAEACESFEQAQQYR